MFGPMSTTIVNVCDVGRAVITPASEIGIEPDQFSVEETTNDRRPVNPAPPSGPGPMQFDPPSILRKSRPGEQAVAVASATPITIRSANDVIVPSVTPNHLMTGPARRKDRGYSSGRNG